MFMDFHLYNYNIRQHFVIVRIIEIVSLPDATVLATGQWDRRADLLHRPLHRVNTHCRPNTVISTL